MDPIANPFAPGAGSPPPELAGREELLETVRVALARIRLGRPSKSILMVGLRGFPRCRTTSLEPSGCRADSSRFANVLRRNGALCEVINSQELKSVQA